MKVELNRDRIKKSIKILVILIILFIIFLYLNKQFSFFIPCIFHKITHLYCPGCGATRMVLSILKLDLYSAFKYNPFLFIISPFLIWYYIVYYINWIQNKTFKINKNIWNVLLICALIFTVLRNIPAFSFLAPH